MAPSEFETRYVVRARIGNSVRNARSGSAEPVSDMQVLPFDV
jgi:hypothetical protein